MARYKTRRQQGAPIVRPGNSSRVRRGQGRPPMKARAGYAANQIHPCRQVLARQGMGLLTEETEE